MFPLTSLRNRLIAMFAGVIAVAMGVLFLYVVPRLRASLVEQRLDRLAAVARQELRAPAVRSAFARGRFGEARRPMLRIARFGSAQVSAYEVVGNVLLPLNEIDEPAVGPDDALLEEARNARGAIVRGRAPRGQVEVAFALPNGVVALSQRTADIDATADLVERRILIATGLALVIAALVGWAAAVAVSRRIERLEQAASRISVGRFGEPIGDDSPDELGRLARSFDLMQSRLGSLDRARKDFIANASHELRTPLFALAGFLELLGDEDLPEETRLEFLDATREQVERLTKLATDLLDLSRLDAGALEVERESIDLAAAARGLVHEFRGVAARNGIRVVLARGGPATSPGIGDEQRVQQIGRVLVDNAVRHNPAGTEVRVGVASSDGTVALAVSDNGPGIDEETRRHLFERFYRGQGASAGGSGLGLAIAHELTERMGGRLEVESEPGRTEFRLVLPAEAPYEPVSA
jgi:signal transduction histidine kinase